MIAVFDGYGVKTFFPAKVNLCYLRWPDSKRPWLTIADTPCTGGHNASHILHVLLAMMPAFGKAAKVINY